MENIAILWDLENVNPGHDSLFIDGLIEFVESKGRIVTARAYCDWGKPAFSKLASVLVKNYFYLVHIPKGRKNSSDIGLISDAFELLRIYTHIDTFILITGDSDFRYLMLSLRGAGKKIYVICNTQNASDELLSLADYSVDYRELLPSEEDDNISSNSIEASYKQPDINEWFTVLQEVVMSIQKEKKKPGLGAVKIRMKKYNPNFDEKNYNFKRWIDFVTAAVKSGSVVIKDELILPNTDMTKKQSEQYQLFGHLIAALQELDENGVSSFHELTSVNRKLMDKGVNIKNKGFYKFKDFMKAAEARNIVEYKVDGLVHSVKLSLK